MMSYKRGEVVLLPFPFTDHSGTKRRPALILSTEDYNARHPDIIVAPITSNVATVRPDDTVLTDWATAGLLKPSVVKALLGTVEQALVVKSLGSLSANDLQGVEQTIAPILGFRR